MVFEEIVKRIDSITYDNKNQNVHCVGVTHDSRKVKNEFLFVAIPGFVADGDSFIPNAIEQGASIIVSEKSQPNCAVPWIQVNDARKALSEITLLVNNIDFNLLFTIGVTGTNGKTTVAGLYKSLIDVLYNEENTALFGTIEYRVGSKTVDATHTTPEASHLLQLIREGNTKAFTMEVASHALALSRVHKYFFDITVWTNLTQDHLDFHKTMEEYYQAKKKLFIENRKDDGVAIINVDDPWGKRLVSEIGGSVVTYGKQKDTDFYIKYSSCTWDGIIIKGMYKGTEMLFKSQMLGDFNVYNISALIAGALAKGVSKNDIQKALNSIGGVPGRMERVDTKQSFTVIVDYAHTPDALKNILMTSEKITKGRLLCLFGCGGDRDRTKRPIMGKTVALNCDEAIVTSDNPRTEDPKKIIDDIVEGIPLDFPHTVVVDRQEGIKKILSMARTDDCVVIAGKGHETYQEINGVRHHFDDREIVRQLLEVL